MDHVHSTTTEHQKGKHLSYEERILIQLRLKDNWSANKIAKEIGCAPNTVRNEILRYVEEMSPCITERYSVTRRRSGNLHTKSIASPVADAWTASKKHLFLPM